LEKEKEKENEEKKEKEKEKEKEKKKEKKKDKEKKKIGEGTEKSKSPSTTSRAPWDREDLPELDYDGYQAQWERDEVNGFNVSKTYYFVTKVSCIDISSALKGAEEKDSRPL
jgi:hypothetical protein